jgi:hypothetical protein
MQAALQRRPLWTYGRDSGRCAGIAEDYKAFEATLIADDDAQSAVGLGTGAAVGQPLRNHRNRFIRNSG